MKTKTIFSKIGAMILFCCLCLTGSNGLVAGEIFVNGAGLGVYGPMSAPKNPFYQGGATGGNPLTYMGTWYSANATVALSAAKYLYTGYMMQADGSPRLIKSLKFKIAGIANDATTNPSIKNVSIWLRNTPSTVIDDRVQTSGSGTNEVNSNPYNSFSSPGWGYFGPSTANNYNLIYTDGSIGAPSVSDEKKWAKVYSRAEFHTYNNAGAPGVTMTGSNGAGTLRTWGANGNQSPDVLEDYPEFEFVLDTPFEYDGSGYLEILFLKNGANSVNTTTNAFKFLTMRTHNGDVFGAEGFFIGAGTPYPQKGYNADKYSYTNANYYATSSQTNLPVVKFIVADMNYNGTEVTNVANNRLNDRTYVVMRANVKTVMVPAPLQMSKFTLNYVGTTAGTKIDKVRIYSTDASTTAPDFQNDTPIATIEGSEIASDLSKNEITLDAPKTLMTGNNYFWIVYDIDPVQTNCSSVLSGGIDDVTLIGTDNPNAGIKNASAYLAAGSETGLVYDEIIPEGIAVDGVLNDGNICSTAPIIVLTAEDNAGTIRGYQWSKLNKTTEEYENIAGATESTLSIYPSDIGTYRVTFIAPYDHTQTSSGCISSGINNIADKTFDLEIITNYPVISTDALVNNVKPTNTIVLCEGEVLHITSDIFFQDPAKTTEPREVRWQYLDDITKEWTNIPQYEFEMPTANTRNLDFIAFSDATLLGRKYKNTKVRMAVFSATPCDKLELEDTVFTNEISIQIYRTPRIVKHLPKVVSLCPGEDFYVSLDVYAEKPLFAQWYKDGNPIETKFDDNGYPILELSFDSVTYSHAGQYTYTSASQTSSTCANAVTIDGIPTLVIADTVDLVVLPKTEMMNISPSDLRVNEGKIAVFEVAAHYATKVPEGSVDDAFQWYRYNGLTRQSVKLEDSYRIKGAKSSMLIINDVRTSDYTFNTDYYYCTVDGRCSKTAVQGKPIYLIPGANLVITKQPADTTICNNKTQVTLNMEAFTSEATSYVDYQWYYNNEALTYDGTFEGVDTETLKIAIDTDSHFPEKFYCKSWLVDINGHGSDTVVSNEVQVTVIDNYNVQVTDISSDKVSVETDSELKLFVRTANPTTDVISWYKDGVFTGKTGNEYVVSHTTNTDAGTYSLKINNGCSDFIPTQKIVVTVVPKQPVTDIIEENVLKTGIDLIPNPATESINVYYNSNADTYSTIDILDLRGSVLYSFETNSVAGFNTYKLNLNKLNIEGGNYFVRVNINGKYFIKSFIFSK